MLMLSRSGLIRASSLQYDQHETVFCTPYLLGPEGPGSDSDASDATTSWGSWEAAEVDMGTRGPDDEAAVGSQACPLFILSSCLVMVPTNQDTHGPHGEAAVGSQACPGFILSWDFSS